MPGAQCGGSCRLPMLGGNEDERLLQAGQRGLKLLYRCKASVAGSHVWLMKQRRIVTCDSCRGPLGSSKVGFPERDCSSTAPETCDCPSVGR